MTDTKEVVLTDEQLEAEFPATDELLEVLGVEKKGTPSSSAAPGEPLPLYVTEVFGRLFREGNLADVVFVCGEKETERIPAHKLVLAAHSLLFELMLYENPDENDKKENDVLEIKLPSVDPAIMKAFLQAIYTDKIEFEGSSVNQLLALANKYRVEKIQEAYTEFLETGLTPENVLTMLEIAPGLAESEAFKKIMEESSDEVLGSEAFLKLKRETLASLLKSDGLAVDEVDLFNAFVRWTEEELKRLGKKAEDRKALFGDLIQFIRFPLMNPTQVAVSVSKCNILDEKDMLQLYQYISIKDEKIRALIKVPFNTKTRAERWRVLLPPLESAPYEKWQGAFHFIGTGAGKKAFTNPHLGGEVIMSSGGSWSSGSSFSDKDLVEPLDTGRSVTTDINVSAKWFQVDLKEWRLDCTHYAMKNGGGRGLVLRDWNLEARVSETDSWEVLREHRNDGTYADDGQGGFGLHVFECKKREAKEPKFYRFFRINRTDSTSNIYCHRWELYGKLKKLRGSKEDSKKSARPIPTSGTATFTCHAHALTWQIPYGFSGWSCDVCRSSHGSGEQSWHCSSCNYDLCTSCVPKYY